MISQHYTLVKFEQFFAVFPSIQVYPVKHTATAPITIIFTCTSTAKPQASVYWMRNGVVLSESTQYLINYTLNGSCSSGSINQCVSSSRLEILNTRAIDSGEYTCVAANGVGRESANVLLTIQGIPLQCRLCVCICVGK